MAYYDVRWHRIYVCFYGLWQPNGAKQYVGIPPREQSSQFKWCQLTCLRSKGSATCAKIQVTHTDLDWQQISGPQHPTTPNPSGFQELHLACCHFDQSEPAKLSGPSKRSRLSPHFVPLALCAHQVPGFWRNFTRVQHARRASSINVCICENRSTKTKRFRLSDLASCKILVVVMVLSNYTINNFGVFILWAGVVPTLKAAHQEPSE